jgi:hypothetical protein
MSELKFQHVFAELSSSFLHKKRREREEKKRKKENVGKEQFVILFLNICQTLSLFSRRKL